MPNFADIPLNEFHDSHSYDRRYSTAKCSESDKDSEDDDDYMDEIKRDMSNSEPQEQEQPLSMTPQVTPSIRLLFSFIPRRHLLFLVLPALFASIVAGGVAPFMTFVVGQAFEAFSQFPLSPNPSQEARVVLLHNVGIAALELIGLAVGSLALSSVTSCLWIWIGEINAMRVRKEVYRRVAGKEMAWFDMNSPTTGETESGTGGSVGAGGLMAKFSRETDEVRMASSLASGMLVQYLTTCITCLILAFMRSWALTLVILSAVPLLTLIQGFSQVFSNPLLSYERQQTAIAATLIERATTSISTVKAFNAQRLEHTRATSVFGNLYVAARKLYSVWSVTAGMAQFVSMAMFVQGFWFGGKLVREGKVSAGDVMAVFWACLIASSNLQMCIPQLLVLAKGKTAMAELVQLIQAEAPPAPRNASFVDLSLDSNSDSKPAPAQPTRKYTPKKCKGSLALHDITFAYPSRPTLPVLTNLSLFLPARETTFIVGSSGSGKSTIAHLLAGMYTPQQGVVELDGWDIGTVDAGWVREHVGVVGQMGAEGVVVFEGRSVAVNVAVTVEEYVDLFMGMSEGGIEGEGGGEGEQGKTKMMKDVKEACRAALMHEFVRDLPMGYETVLGGGAGVGLSGGQKQRLAIARARIRNPTVLILDEAMSALDPTSRILVFEALKQWRKNKTTIVITHDLSQITAEDFVYVLKDGQVVEQGYRTDLEDSGKETYYKGPRGEFRRMAQVQEQSQDEFEERDAEDSQRVDARNRLFNGLATPARENTQSPGLLTTQHTLALRPVSNFGNWMFDVVADLTSAPNSPRGQRNAPLPNINAAVIEGGMSPRPQSQHFFDGLASPSPVFSSPTHGYGYGHGQRFSTPPGLGSGMMLETPTSATFTNGRPGSAVLDFEEADEGWRKERETREMERSALRARMKRRTRMGLGLGRDAADYVDVEKERKMNAGADGDHKEVDGNQETPVRLLPLLRVIYPQIPGKPLLFFGLTICVLNGAMTPLFSFLLSRLLFEVSTGAQNIVTINRVGALVLGVAALDGLLLGLKYIIMELCGMSWITSLRTTALSLILAQDKEYFDCPDNAPPKLVQIMMKDADDARDVVALVIGQVFVVGTMLGVGLVWACVRGWQLTLAGVAVVPVFAGLMAVQSGLVARAEVRNKRAREEVARGYYETIINIRAIRAMAFDRVFRMHFDEAVEKSLMTGVRGAFVEGCTHGLASGLIYLAEALLFYVGALLLARGTYTYLQMVEVLNLVVFSVTIGSQLMAFTEKITKSSQAASDLTKLTKLDTTSHESRGSLRPDFTGDIQFTRVDFSYPQRLNVPVLRDMSFHIAHGECVAIVGSSGCGKSTLTSLLQRLYEPTHGTITIGDIDISHVDVTHLRDHVAVVSQHPHLFDASIAENIRYGHPGISDRDIRRACRAANIHRFIKGLPKGYDTPLGENASLFSGGQAQRMQIARALARPRTRVLVLDECTSSLDAENRRVVLETLEGVRRRGDTTVVVVTHNLEVMKVCERVLVVQRGVVVEEGTYGALVERKGVFASLARGGEWID